MINRYGTNTAFSLYLKNIKKAEIHFLEKEEEKELFRKYQENGDEKARKKLIVSHLGLVISIAKKWKGYNIHLGDLIAEGNIGLVIAIEKFDIEKGARLSTCAKWWIKASVHECVMRSWSLVKIGTTAAQKKLFFNLRRIKNQLEAVDEGDLHPDHVKKIADELDVKEDEVVQMNRRMSGSDYSLNAPMHFDRLHGMQEWQDLLVDENTLDQETAYADSEERAQGVVQVDKAVEILNDREKVIFIGRRLVDVKITLQELGERFNVSRERIRQIENKAFEKVSKFIKRKTLKLLYI